MIIQFLKNFNQTGVQVMKSGKVKGLLAIFTMALLGGGGIVKGESVSIVQGRDWQPITNKKTIESGSVLDLSFMSDAPAGKYGGTVIRNGRFEFEHRLGVPVKFFGPNLSYDLNFPDKKDASVLADTLQKMGYNVVRFHHFEVGLLSDQAKPVYEGTFKSEQLDKLDYLFYCLKVRGIYALIDLHTLREFAPEDSPELNRRFGREIAFLIHISPTARKAWERFARDFLTHRNPYTGLTWAEDPALAGICPINEDFIYGAPFPLYAKTYERWLAENKIVVNGEAQNLAAYTRFLTELQNNTLLYYRNFLNSLGVKAPITGANNVEYIVQTLIRQPLDFVSNHCYWNHPDSFPGTPWRIPWMQTIAVSEVSRSSGIHRVYGPTRILGKPFAVTEFNYCYPNLYRGEGGPLMGAYAAFQNWDCLNRFDYGHDADALTQERVAYVFGAVYDPINRLTETIIALLFRRGDVSPARQSIPYVVTADVACQRYKVGLDYFPDSYRPLALCTGVGSLDVTDPHKIEGRYPVVVGRADKLPGTKFYADGDGLVKRLIADRVIDGARCQESAGRYISDTGQLDLNALNGTFKVTSPRSEAFVQFNRGRLTGGLVTVDNQGGACTVLVSAVDNQPISKSKRLLILHLTDVQNNKIKFNKEMTILENIGELPHLVRRGTASISIRLDSPRPVTIWAVDLSGKRQKKMPFRQDGTVVRLTVETIQPEGTFLAYELVTGDQP